MPRGEGTYGKKRGRPPMTPAQKRAAAAKAKAKMKRNK